MDGARRYGYALRAQKSSVSTFHNLMNLHQRPSVVLLNPFEDERHMYAEYLSATGFDVQPYEHAEDTIGAVAAAPPDAIVMRLRPSQSGLSGIDLLRRVKHSVWTRHVPVVIMTTSPLRVDRAVAADALCDSYLLLPVIPDQLAREIRRLLAARSVPTRRAG